MIESVNSGGETVTQNNSPPSECFSGSSGSIVH